MQSFSAFRRWCDSEQVQESYQESSESKACWRLNMNRAVSFEYMNRQLPLLNLLSIRKIILPYPKDKSCGSIEDVTACPIALAKQIQPFGSWLSLVNRGHRQPDKAIDLVDEACATVRVQRYSQPEEIDNLERKRIQVEVVLHALE